jgi:DNA-binding winged helix-turn-helix (wHTH) protein
LKVNGDFRLDGWLVQPQLNSVCNANEVIRLEPKVMQVLVQLALHPDEVMTKGQLIEAVWPDTHVGEHVLTRCVSELRRVFGEDARVPRYIQNVPKVGYRLIAPVLPAALAEPPQLPQTSSANLAELPPRSIVEAPVLPEHGRLAHGIGRRILWAALVLTVVAIVGFLASSSYRFLRT